MVLDQLIIGKFTLQSVLSFMVFNELFLRSFQILYFSSSATVVFHKYGGNLIVLIFVGLGRNLHSLKCMFIFSKSLENVSLPVYISEVENRI